MPALRTWSLSRVLATALTWLMGLPVALFIVFEFRMKALGRLLSTPGVLPENGTILSTTGPRLPHFWEGPFPFPVVLLAPPLLLILFWYRGQQNPAPAQERTQPPST